MGYLTTYDDDQQAYYQGNNLGSYQFTSLEDIITKFQITYVGENKLIPKLKKADVSYYAMRALQELSFDTFKSIKSQQIDVPPALTMKLPRDYVNYTKLSWVDSCGIKHPIYPTNDTSNPFQIKQDPTGDYIFECEGCVEYTPPPLAARVFPNIYALNNFFIEKDNLEGITTDDPVMGNGVGSSNYIFTHQGIPAVLANGETIQNVNPFILVTQSPSTAVNVTSIDSLTLRLKAKTRTITEGTTVLRIGLRTTDAFNEGSWYGTDAFNFSSSPGANNRTLIDPPGNWLLKSSTYFDVLPMSGGNRYLEWSSVGDAIGYDNTSTQQITFDTSQITGKVFLTVVSWMNLTNADANIGVVTNNNDWNGVTEGLNYVNKQITDIGQAEIVEIMAYNPGLSPIVSDENWTLSPSNADGNSSTWNNYKSCGSDTCGDGNCSCDDYTGERYGLDPQRAQVNGSFYIDQNKGKIHFSSNISGKTVILDYISDSVGTDKEMKVHKFAEAAMYKHILHGVMSTSSYGQQLVPRLKKEKFAAVRKAKLRLASTKLHEFKQILKGKSKQIKH
jgi:hypothetical protein